VSEVGHWGATVQCQGTFVTEDTNSAVGTFTRKANQISIELPNQTVLLEGKMPVNMERGWPETKPEVTFLLGNTFAGRLVDTLVFNNERKVVARIVFRSFFSKLRDSRTRELSWRQKYAYLSYRFFEIHLRQHVFRSPSCMMLDQSLLSETEAKVFDEELAPAEQYIVLSCLVLVQTTFGLPPGPVTKRPIPPIKREA
jgi:hypothetical protein